MCDHLTHHQSSQLMKDTDYLAELQLFEAKTNTPLSMIILILQNLKQNGYLSLAPMLGFQVVMKDFIFMVKITYVKYFLISH